jgi:hypothetical protein
MSFKPVLKSYDLNTLYDKRVGCDKTYALYTYHDVLWGFIHIRKLCYCWLKVVKYLKVVRMKKNNRRKIIDNFKNKQVQIYRFPSFTLGCC